MIRKVILYAVLLIFGQISPLAYAANERQLMCRVVGISDGDTLTCLSNQKSFKVRLQHIDAPESAQSYGNRAKQMLAALVFKKQVILQVSGYDKYQRVLAVVYDQDKNINLMLVQQGMAWAYRQTQPIYKQAQAQAQQKRIGLWQDAKPIEPFEWRKLKGNHYDRGAITAPQSTAIFPQPSNSFDCSQKLTCANFRDFNQANRYFRQCGSKTMDGNNDGIPCNSLYRKMKKQQ